MKSNVYLNVILTVIAACLVILTLRNLSIIPQAMAEQKSPPPNGYTMVPVNADGQVEVVVKSFDDRLDVNLEQVGGYGCYNGIPVIQK